MIRESLRYREHHEGHRWEKTVRHPCLDLHGSGWRTEKDDDDDDDDDDDGGWRMEEEDGGEG
ncbi:hypothetical protein N7517_010352 [Penicillium concentricum]|uniref:Uncharacterized protein n=1 Tax=Penicillium concentricum TaxID=293559 RepID=A0A9W9R8Z5_9EURO|nr:uncharacterized protein N7517_010352 [Penicillium concentricum]KAJ5355743.1 hypothetical protein N7517_010352 [Penicillium concentricum]